MLIIHFDIGSAECGHLFGFCWGARQVNHLLGFRVSGFFFGASFGQGIGEIRSIYGVQRHYNLEALLGEVGKGQHNLISFLPLPIHTCLVLILQIGV
jgi:hypothetical protein